MTLNKTEFVRNCFSAVLSDGQPHHASEIQQYVYQQAKGTPYEGQIEHGNIIQAFYRIIGSGSEYQRIRRGVYQKCAPTAEASTIPSRKDGLYSILDSACELIDQMHSTFSALCEKMPEAKELIEPDYKMAAKCLDQSILGISAWIAHMEDIADGIESVEGEETEIAMGDAIEAPTMQM